MSKLIFASVVSEIQQSDIYMTVKACICEAPQANLNGARVTEAFIDEIVGNEARYVGLPLYADKKALMNGNFTRLGHLYDEKTGEFHSTQIGSFYKFEKQSTAEGCCLIGYARIPKRNKKLSKAICELFSDGKLKFSFEVCVGEYSELEDDTILIDASENNYLEGTAIVTYPACEDAVALELVAQKADEAQGGESEMTGAKVKTKVAEAEVKTQAEQAEAIAKDENAAVYVTESHTEVQETYAYDSETGKSVNQRVVVETSTSDAVEGTLVETTDGIHVAETEIAEGDGDAPSESGGENTETPTSGETPGGETPTSGETPGATTPEENGETTETPGDQGGAGGTNDSQETVEDPPVVHVEDQKKTAELIVELTNLINSLRSETAELKAEIAELKQPAPTENNPVIGEINPFMGSLTAEKKYSLLESEPKKTSYSLLE